ncbi:collagen binding domain-containing protein [Dethiobacter alkaliphilus]|uniref:Prealbumin-like fold domain-containing protein n=1 Tax=Dethiobacter alkaliphilus AHT 1 TaxID=555088 RepID=C0GEE3_DETAL|nr:hypothetical protein [Dethiobacter alkaliphilus]EEG78437.1 hypothetical protein DealDRAFT_0852 [Dethiobacter alkaliphilus AHT 1]
MNMAKPVSKYWRVGLVLLVIGLLAIGTALGSVPPCEGPLVDPVEYNGNPEEIGTRINDPGSGYIDVEFDGVWYKVFYEVYDGGKTLKFWEENGFPVVSKVTVKGGPNANIYYYAADPPEGLGVPVASDCGLQSPRHGKNIPGISYVEFEFEPPPTGSLKVIKIWDDQGTGVVYDGTIDVNIYDSEGTLVDTLILSDANNWEDDLGYLLPGVYTFAEVTPDGWTPSYDPANRELVVEAGDDPAAGAIGTITNTIDLGSLKVIKIWDDQGTGVVYDGTIDVNIYDSEGTLVDTLILSDTNNWEDDLGYLLPGVYTFAEVTPDGWTPATTRQTVS